MLRNKFMDDCHAHFFVMYYSLSQKSMDIVNDWQLENNTFWQFDHCWELLIANIFFIYSLCSC